MAQLDAEQELQIIALIEREREKNNKLFAQKLVEHIVFYGVGAISIAVLGAILNLVIS